MVLALQSQSLSTRSGCYASISLFSPPFPAGALAPTVALKTSLSLIVFSVNILGVGFLLPFRLWMQNVANFIVACLAGAQVLFYLGLLQLWSKLAVFWFCSLLIVFSFWL